jgi:SAM-dependent methyltransferase
MRRCPFSRDREGMISLNPAPTVGDAFGHILARCWAANGRRGVAYEVVERDDGHIGVADAAGYFASPADWSPAERWGCEQALGRVLDIGCGAGRHAIPLSQVGHEVVGIDTSRGAVEVACSRGMRAVRGSISELPASVGVFSTILLAGNNLGLLGEPDRAKGILNQLADFATPQARLIGSGTDPYATENPAHLAYHASNRERGRPAGLIRMRVRDGVVATDWFDYSLYALDELTEIVSGTRWTLHSVEQDVGSYCVRLDLC